MSLDLKHLLQPGFRARRAMNWVSLGLLYAAYYMARYNITIANPILRETFGWSKEQIGMIVAAGFWTYGLSVFFNGPLADRIGGAVLCRAGRGAGGTAFQSGVGTVRVDLDVHAGVDVHSGHAQPVERRGVDGLWRQEGGGFGGGTV